MSNQVQQVKEASDIVAVLGERLSLQRAGRNFKALCPFHSEKSPSFFVTPELQTFKCFGCGEGGDVFTFLERYEGMTFVEALQYLADQAGITLERFQSTQEDDQRARLLEILSLTKDYYHYLLTKHELGKPAREYLKQRGITAQSIKQFQLGYALSGWDGLIKYLVGKKKNRIQDLEAAGLVIPRNQRGGNTKLDSQFFYDRFRDRLMFPLTDHRGRVVGFSGRVLNNQEKSAKYINTPETQLYHKSKLLFGYSQHYRAIREVNSVLVMEGEMDVISSSQAHVSNVVAIKGSALTKEQIELLARAADTIILSLDTDSAGVEATKRSIGLITQFGDLKLRVLPMSVLDGKDPDDIARDDPSAWREAVKQSVSAYQFLIDVAFSQHDANSGEGKQAIIKEVAQLIEHISYAVEKAHYVSQLAERLKVSEQVIQEDLRKAKAFPNAVNPPSQTKQAVEGEDRDELYMLGLILHLPEDRIIQLAKRLDPQLLRSEAIKKIIQAIVSNNQFTFGSFRSRLPPELIETATASFLAYQQSDQSVEAEFETLLKSLKNRAKNHQIEQLTAQLDQLESQQSLTPQEEQQLSEILQRIITLRGKGKAI